MFTAVCLVTGMIWGHPTWGVYWTWDARLTTTSLLFVLFLGYLALRRMPAEPSVRAKRAAILGILAFIDVPIVHQSVEWWRTLHQDATILRLDLDVSRRHHAVHAVPRVRRVHVDLRMAAAPPPPGRGLEDALDEHGLELAIDERRAEGMATA